MAQVSGDSDIFYKILFLKMYNSEAENESIYGYMIIEMTATDDTSDTSVNNVFVQSTPELNNIISAQSIIPPENITMESVGYSESDEIKPSETLAADDSLFTSDNAILSPGHDFEQETNSPIHDDTSPYSPEKPLFSNF